MSTKYYLNFKIFFTTQNFKWLNFYIFYRIQKKKIKNLEIFVFFNINYLFEKKKINYLDMWYQNLWKQTWLKL